MKDHKLIAEQCIEAVGGKDNITSVSTCATRLRIDVIDYSKVNEEKIKNEIEGVKGYIKVGNQGQIIFGPGLVTKVYKIVSENCGSSKPEAKFNEKQSLGSKVTSLISGIFPPVLPAIVSAGMLMGIRSLLTYFGLMSEDSSWYIMLSVLCQTALNMLPVLYCWSATKYFGGNPILGIVLGLMLISDTLPNAWDVSAGAAEVLKVNIFGLEIGAAGFQGSVLVSVLSGFILAKLENFLRDKVVPSIIDNIFTPLLALSITFFTAMFVFGPIIRQVEHFLLGATDFLLEIPLGIGAFIFTFLYQFIVVTGAHVIFDVAEANSLAITGFNTINPFVNYSIYGQCGACAAFIFLAKTKQLKANAATNTFSAFMGITEPALYTQNLPSKGMCGLICGSLGAGIAAIFSALRGVKATGMAWGAFAFSLYLDTDIVGYLISCGIALVVGFIFNYVVLSMQEKKANK